MNAYFAIFRAALLTLLRYRLAALSGLFTQGFWGVLRISLFLACYAGLSPKNGAPMAVEQVIDYVWLGQACFTLLPIRVDANVAAMMKDGTIAYELSRPLDLYSWWYVRSIALRLAPALLRGPPLALLAALLPSPWGLCAPHDLAAAALFALGLSASLALSAALTALLSVVTVVTINGEGLARLFALCSWLCSGMLLPLSLFPNSLRWLFESLPFAGIIDTPLRMYVGSLRGESALFALGRQLAWTAVLVLIGRKLLCHALRRVVVQGG